MPSHREVARGYADSRLYSLRDESASRSSCGSPWIQCRAPASSEAVGLSNHKIGEEGFAANLDARPFFWLILLIGATVINLRRECVSNILRKLAPAERSGPRSVAKVADRCDAAPTVDSGLPPVEHTAGLLELERSAGAEPKPHVGAFVLKRHIPRASWLERFSGCLRVGAWQLAPRFRVGCRSGA